MGWWDYCGEKSEVFTYSLLAPQGALYFTTPRDPSNPVHIAPRAVQHPSLTVIYHQLWHSGSLYIILYFHQKVSYHPTHFLPFTQPKKVTLKITISTQSIKQTQQMKQTYKKCCFLFYLSILESGDSSTYRWPCHSLSDWATFDCHLLI